MTKSMKKKLTIIGVSFVVIILLIGTTIMNSHPPKTEEQSETKKEIEQEVNEGQNQITKPMTSDRVYQVTLNGYVVTLGKTTLGDVINQTGILLDEAKYSDWEYTSKVKKEETKDKETIETVTNEGSCVITVTTEKREDVWFLVKAYATERPEDIESCIVWGIGANSESNYVLSNNSITPDASYESLCQVFGKPFESTLETAEQTDAMPAEQTEQTEQTDAVPADQPTEEVQTPATDGVVQQTSQAATWKASWYYDKLIKITVDQGKSSRLTEIAIQL